MHKTVEKTLSDMRVSGLFIVLSCVIAWWMISYILNSSLPQTMLSTAVIVKCFSQATETDDKGDCWPALPPLHPILRPPLSVESCSVRVHRTPEASDRQNDLGGVQSRSLYSSHRRWRGQPSEHAEEILLWALHSAVPGRDPRLHSLHVRGLCVGHGERGHQWEHPARPGTWTSAGHSNCHFWRNQVTALCSVFLS